MEMDEGSAFVLGLIDFSLPDIDGITLARRIRALPDRERFPMILLSPVTNAELLLHALAGDREKCLAAGMNDYLAKPLRPDDLHAALKRFVQG